MRTVFIVVYFFSISLYAYTPGLKTLPLRPSSQFITYYLQPVKKNTEKNVEKNTEKNAEKNFLVVQCISGSKKNKLRCKVFSPVYFSLSQLEAIAVDLERWDNYYLGLDVGVFVGILFRKIRSWVWRNPVGRVVGVLALTGEISDFIVQGKQGVAFAVVAKIDQKQAELKELEQSPLSQVLKEQRQQADAKKNGLLMPNKHWIFLEGFTESLINRLLDLLDNV